MEALCLSPDGTKVVGVEFSTGQNIALYDLAAQRMQLLTHFTWDWTSHAAYFPVFSPDGGKIAYLVETIKSSLSPKDAEGLHIMTLDGKDRLLFRADQAFLIPCGWLPDGKAILAMLGPIGKPAVLGLIDAASGIFRPVKTLQGPTQRYMNIPADVSPDGRHVAFHDGVATPAELQARYDALTARIVALVREIMLETDRERRLVAQAKRDELAHERETIAGDMMLLGVAPQQHEPLEHRVTTLEREVTWIKGVLKPGARLLLARVLFYGLLVMAWSMWMVKEIRDWLLLHPAQAVLITIALVCAALIIHWLPEDTDHV